jgi:hypothetical protein
VMRGAHESWCGAWTGCTVAATRMEDLDAPLFGLIAAHLSARDCCSLACVAIAWRNQVDSSLRWRDLCVETFGVGAHAPVGPGACPSDVGGACPTFKAAFAAWTRRFAEYAEGTPLRCSAFAVWSLKEVDGVLNPKGRGLGSPLHLVQG